MPSTQAPNHQGGSRHQGPLCAALNTRGGLIYPRVALIAGVLPSSAHSTTRKYRQHTHVTAAASRLCKQKSSCQVLRHGPGLSPVCSFVRAHLPRLFLAARITHCERARDRKWARLPRGMAVRVALSVRFAHRAPSSNQNNSSGHSHSEKGPVRVAWAIPAGDTWDIKP